MKLSRIDLIAQNGGDGAHYKYEEVAKRLFEEFYGWIDYIPEWMHNTLKKNIMQILMEEFPNDET